MWSWSLCRIGAAMMPGSHETFLGVWVDVPGGGTSKAPVATSVVVDTSGSMAGEKIVNARAAAKRFLDGLNDGDIASLVRFDDSAREIVAPTRLDRVSRARLSGAVSELSADGALALVADTQNHTIRKLVVSTGEVTTLAGSPRNAGSANGTGSTARFFHPEAVALSGDGTLALIADTDNHTIRKLVVATDPAGRSIDATLTLRAMTAATTTQGDVR